MNSPIKKVAFTIYPVVDLARARSFYEGTLGLKPGSYSHENWQEYDFGGTTFAISPMIIEFVKPGTQGSVAFEVADVDAWVRDLRAKGLKLDDVMDTPVCRMAFVKDPDGNTVSLH